MRSREGRTPRWRRHVARGLVTAVCFLAGVSFLPFQWCSRHADLWYDGEGEPQRKLGRGMAHWLDEALSRADFDTGSAQFSGEWLFGTYMMAGMGFGQLALRHPETRAGSITRMETCIERILSDEVRAFDRETWGNDPIETLDQDRYHDHAAYLGYLNLVLGLHRLLVPESNYAELHDRITEALVRRVQSSPISLIQSYPHEVYPVDNCCVIGSIGLHARATGTDRSELLKAWSGTCRAKYMDPETGLLIQAVEPGTGQAIDAPRGSGTALGLYALSFADMPLSRELYASVRTHLARSVLGFGGVKEYPGSVAGGHGDIDSGPLVFGFGLSPTGFLLAGTGIHGDREYFRRLWATAYAWGAPVEKGDRLNFVTGGALGDAILFAMLTAGPPDLEPREPAEERP